MGTVYDFFKSTVKSFKVIAAKTGAFVLLVFFLGMLLGGTILAWDLSLLWFVAFFLSIIITWNDFGEGMTIFFLLVLLFLMAPWVFPPISI
ncbi:MAG: hypothetical protein AABY11_00135 [archaeon]